MEIGPLVNHSELEASPLIAKSFTALAMAASTVGSPQIRNRGTLGGNLQSASPAADCVPPLLVFDAMLTLVSLSGKREVGIADFFWELEKQFSDLMN
ncbi:MAG: FAD binding domain-containing protein [Desulfosporosinus sp.]|nr:FAD binding domain-containing protein [Desulfosporosinus sp.]